MGLNISHGCWSGAYSAFNRWRNKLAEAAGYWVMKFPSGHETATIDWGHVSEANLLGDWDEVPKDPLIILIAHSDCDGIIRSEHAGLLADRIGELLALLPDGDGGGHIGNWRDKTQEFVDGLRFAHQRGEDVVFC